MISRSIDVTYFLLFFFFSCISIYFKSDSLLTTAPHHDQSLMIWANSLSDFVFPGNKQTRPGPVYVPNILNTGGKCFLQLGEGWPLLSGLWAQPEHKFAARLRNGPSSTGLSVAALNLTTILEETKERARDLRLATFIVSRFHHSF